MIELETIKAWTDILTKWIGVLAIVFGGFFTLNEYIKHEKQVREAATLDFLRRFNNEGNQEAWTIIRKAQQSANTEFAKLLSRNDVPPDKLAEEYSIFVIRVVEDHNLVEPIDRVTVLFEEIANCISLDICDQESAVRFFRRKGGEFFRYWYPYFCRERSRWNDPSIGQTLEFFYNPPRDTVRSVCDI